MSSSAFESLVIKNTETNPAQAKFQFVTEPALPAKCSSCGKDSTGRNRFVDWNLSIDYYGSVLLCEDCSLEVVALFDYVNPVKVIEVESFTKELLTENEDLREKVQALSRVIAIFGLDPVKPDSSSSDDEPLFVVDVSEDNDDKFG